MLEIEQLERDYKRYKLKKIRPYILASISFTAVIISIIFLDEIKPFTFFKGESEIISEKNNSSQNVDTEINISKKMDIVALDEKKVFIPKSTYSDNNESSLETKSAQKSILLSPDTSFLVSFATNSNYKSDNLNEKKKIASSYKENIEEKKEVTDSTPIEKPKTVSSNNLIVSTKKNNNTLAHLIKKYNEKKDAKLASYISNSYYKKGNYKEALKWSIEANSLDPSNEESWILFAKSNVKLGRKDVAIQALKVYLNQYSSKSVKTMLKSLESSR